MVLFSTTAIFSSVLLPLLTATAFECNGEEKEVTTCQANNMGARSLFHRLLRSGSPIRRVNKKFFRSRSPNLTLPQLWAVSHMFAFAVLLASALTKSTSTSVCLFSALGISWAATQWIPFALISVSCKNTLLGTRNQGASSSPAIRDKHSTLTTGVALGISNVAIAGPQIIAIIISSGIFYILDIGQMDNTLAIGWLIRGWGISHLAAAFWALRLPMAFERGDRRS